MISDEERRKVARRLRKLDHVVTNRDTIESGVNKFIKAVYVDRPYSPIECSTRNLCGLAMTLADLIDRPTCRNVDDEVYDEYEGGCCENGFKCSKCGELVEDCEGYRVKGTFNYCPNCGAEVVE